MVASILGTDKGVVPSIFHCPNSTVGSQKERANTQLPNNTGNNTSLFQPRSPWRMTCPRNHSIILDSYLESVARWQLQDKSWQICMSSFFSRYRKIASRNIQSDKNSRKEYEKPFSNGCLPLLYFCHKNQCRSLLSYPSWLVTLWLCSFSNYT